MSNRIPLALFSRQDLRVVNPHLEDFRRTLFNAFPNDPTEGPDHQTLKIAKEAARESRQGLCVTVTKKNEEKGLGNLYLQFYPYTEQDNSWHRLSDYIEKGQWKPDHVNRMSFWMKPPKGIWVHPTAGGPNFHVGAYVAGPDWDPKDPESDRGLHPYHYFAIPDLNEWIHLTVDTHPSHIRNVQNADGSSKEFRSMPYPTGDKAKKHGYFDAMSRFYLDFRQGLQHYPADFYVDNFELWRGNWQDNINSVYSVWSSYVPSSKKVHVGWGFRKDKDPRFNLRWSPTSFYRVGWKNGKSLRGGDGLKPPAGGGYCYASWSGWVPGSERHKTIYIGISPVGENRFREVKVLLK